MCVRERHWRCRYLFRGQAPHVGAVGHVGEVVSEGDDVGADGDLVLPLKLRPHPPELGVGASSRHDVIHDVHVDVVQHDAVSVAGHAGNVVHCTDAHAHAQQS